MSTTAETAATSAASAGEQTSNDQGVSPPAEASAPESAATAAVAEAAAAVLDNTSTTTGERDHIERDVSNILAGLNQEQLASIVAAARASEARNPSDESALAASSTLPYGLGQAASALTSIASGFKRTPGKESTEADKDVGQVQEKELDADTTAAIQAVKSATDTATAAALASLGSLAASNQAQDADESNDYDSPNGSASPSRGIKRPRSSAPELDRQRKDNHKEVERRRRSAINDGIVQLSHIVPGCDAKNTNKGAIIHAAVRYIQDLKHNEASNIEKWTLEKLLMDQAMGDLSAQLDEANAQVERLRQELYGQQDAEGAQEKE